MKRFDVSHLPTWFWYDVPGIDMKKFSQYEMYSCGKALSFLDNLTPEHSYNESVENFDVLSNGAKRPDRESMGKYIEALEKIKEVDPRMLEVLKHIKNLRRNPIAHPEHFLDMEDALITFDIAKSAISIMTKLSSEHEKKRKP